MDCAESRDVAVGDIIRTIEDAVEKANLLALELTLRCLENEKLTDGYAAELSAVSQVASRAALATDEIERLVRRLKAA